MTFTIPKLIQPMESQAAFGIYSNNATVNQGKGTVHLYDEIMERMIDFTVLSLPPTHERYQEQINLQSVCKAWKLYLSSRLYVHLPSLGPLSGMILTKFLKCPRGRIPRLTIKSIEFHDLNLAASQVEIHFDLVTLLQNCKNLKSLTLETPAHFFVLRGAGPRSAGSWYDRLESLDFKYRGETEHLRKAFAECTNLLQLGFSIGLPFEGPVPLLPPNLTKLRIKNGLTEEFRSEALSTWFNLNDLHLDSLNLYGWPIDTWVRSPALKTLKSLTLPELYYSETPLHITLSHFTSLRELTLHNVMPGLFELVKGLEQHCPGLEKIYIQAVRLGTSLGLQQSRLRLLELLNTSTSALHRITLVSLPIMFNFLNMLIDVCNRGVPFWVKDSPKRLRLPLSKVTNRWKSFPTVGYVVLITFRVKFHPRLCTKL